MTNKPDDSAPQGEAPAKPAASDSLHIGTDEWVAQHTDRQEARRGAVAMLAVVRNRLPAPVLWGVPLILLLLFPMMANGYLLRVGVNLGLFLMLSLGLNVVVGYAGLLDLGYVAFYGFGAYSYALLSSNQFGVHLPTWVAVPLVVIASAVLGLLVSLPSRRLLGDYLAIVTLFFGEVFLEFLSAGDTISVPWAKEPVNVTGGAY